MGGSPENAGEGAPARGTDHLARLRELVGHDDAGRVLLRRHEGDSPGWGAWGVIGGGLRLDESPRDGARRKVRDAGIEVGELTLLDVVGGPEFRLVYPNGDETSNVCSLFGASLAGERSDLVAWFDPAELAAASMPSLSRALLRHLGLLA